MLIIISYWPRNHLVLSKAMCGYNHHYSHFAGGEVKGSGRNPQHTRYRSFHSYPVAIQVCSGWALGAQLSLVRWCHTQEQKYSQPFDLPNPLGLSQTDLAQGLPSTEGTQEQQLQELASRGQQEPWKPQAGSAWEASTTGGSPGHDLLRPMLHVLELDSGLGCERGGSRGALNSDAWPPPEIPIPWPAIPILLGK